MRYVRFVKVLAAGAALGAAAALFFLCRLERPGPAIVAPAAKTNAAFPRERFTPVPVVEDRVPLRERLKPGRRKTRAEELLAGMPPGTEAYEVTGGGGEGALIYRTPAGEVFVPNETRATVRAYRRAAPFAQLELRPGVFAWTDLSRIGGGAAVNVVRLGRVHAGPAASYDSGRTLSLGLTAGYNVWRNVDVGAYGGKAVGKEGWRGGVGITVRSD